MKRGFVWLGVTLVAVVIACFWLLRAPKALPRSALVRSAAAEIEPVRVEPARPSEPVAPPVISPPALPSARFQPRDPEEWQGMLLRAGPPAPCESADGCGLALACKGGKCVACQSDSDCAQGEGCVLDHCLRKELISCHRRVDCDRDSQCILSGYTAQRRGNEDMRSLCVSKNSGAASIPNTDPPSRIDTRKSLPNDDLIERANNALKSD